MKQPHLCLAIASLCFGSVPKGIGQPNTSGSGSSDLPSPREERKTLDSTATTCAPIQTSAGQKVFQGIRITGGQLTIPFKIRHKPEHGTFRLTTDVTLGAFVGLTKRLSDKKENYLTIPMTAGLTFININNNNTSMEFAATNDGGTDVVPGLTWSSGIILQLDQYNIGLIFGKDYASEVGDQWIYHRKWWWSFGLGFSFTK